VVNLSKVSESLKKKGYRSSGLREAVLTILKQNIGPITISVLTSGLEKLSLKPNKTSIYREMDTLLKEQVIEEFDLGEGKKRYELKPAKGHHHHLICTNCGKVECLEMDSDLEKLTKQIEHNTKYTISKHNLDFEGLCPTCQIVNHPK
jgi:Fur family transcriptional regulator, ferric uptake regulator